MTSDRVSSEFCVVFCFYKVWFWLIRLRLFKWQYSQFCRSGHPGDQKLVSVLGKSPFRTDLFNWERAADGQKQTGRIRQMKVSYWPL
jgi:hypothetical protein